MYTAFVIEMSVCNFEGEAVVDLVKDNIHDYKIKNKATVQITLDDDFNVPDAKPDINQIVKERGLVHIQSVRVNDGKADVAGELEFGLLYISDMPVNMSGHMDFQEKINVEGLVGDENTICFGEIEDLTIKAINSRKVSIKAILGLTVISEKLEDEQMAVGVDISRDNNESNIQIKNKDIDISEITCNMKDNFRIKENVELPTGKPNIAELLWYDIAIKSIETRPAEDGLAVSGEVSLFVLYMAADENQSIQWYETASAFEGMVDVSGCNADMIAYVSHQIQSCDVEVKPDFDGEDRVISVELVLDLNIKAYEEKQLSIIDDMYSPIEKIEIEKNVAHLHKLLIKNNSKCRINQRLKVGADNQILQICNCTGTAKVDDISVMDGGIEVDGVVIVNVFYVASNDNVPMGCIHGTIPFHHRIEVKGIGDNPDNIQYTINVNLEQLNAVMAGGEEIEIKAVISLDTICFEIMKENAIKGIDMCAIDDNVYNQIPSITGYMVKKDDTLWNIAKSHYTTVDKIQSCNKLQSERVSQGDKLILIKAQRG